MYINQINRNRISHLYYETLNKSITNIETDSSTIFSIDQTTQYTPIGWEVSTNNNLDLF